MKEFISLMIDIKDKIIYLPDYSQLDDLYFVTEEGRTKFPNTKYAIDGSLIKKNFDRNEGTLFIDR